MNKRQRKKYADLAFNYPAGPRKKRRRWTSNALDRQRADHPQNLRRVTLRNERFLVVARRNGIPLPKWRRSDSGPEERDVMAGLLRVDAGNDRADWEPVPVPPLGHRATE